MSNIDVCIIYKHMYVLFVNIRGVFVNCECFLNAIRIEVEQKYFSPISQQISINRYIAH